MRFHRRSKLHRLLVQIRFLKKNFEGINFCGLDKSKHFAGTNFRDFVRKPQKLVPAKISTIKVFLLKILEILWCSDTFSGNRTELFHLTLLSFVMFSG